MLGWVRLERTRIAGASSWNSQSSPKCQGIQMLSGAEGCLRKDYYVTVVDPLNPLFGLEEASRTQLYSRSLNERTDALDVLQ